MTRERAPSHFHTYGFGQVIMTKIQISIYKFTFARQKSRRACCQLSNLAVRSTAYSNEIILETHIFKNDYAFISETKVCSSTDVSSTSVTRSISAPIAASFSWNLT